MKCPVCKNHEQQTNITLKTEGFAEKIVTCRVCGTAWAVNHGLAEIITDPQERSFLESTSECVEGFDYSFAA